MTLITRKAALAITAGQGKDTNGQGNATEGPKAP